MIILKIPCIRIYIYVCLCVCERESQSILYFTMVLRANVFLLRLILSINYIYKPFFLLSKTTTENSNCP